MTTDPVVWVNSRTVELMKLGRAVLLIFLLSPTGCSFVGYGIHNAINAPFDAVQECAFRYRLRQRAREEWQKTPCEERESHSAAYAKGFEDGFVDYIDANGTGEPPAMAPKHLRAGLLQLNDGQEDIEAWFDGFRHGARVAQETGLREQVVMPIGRPARTPVEPLPAQVVVPFFVEEPVEIIPPPKAIP